MSIKGLLVVTFICLCLMTSVYALVDANINANINEKVDVKVAGVNVSEGIGQKVSVMIEEKKTEYKEGNFTTSLGQYLSVKTMVAGNLELREGGIAVRTRLNLTKVEKDKEASLEVKLSNGRNVQVKVMPSAASGVALSVLRVSVCSEENNCMIELKEVGVGSSSRVEYDVQVERHARILGIFKKKMQVSAQVDAETGIVIGEHKPWWAFIATEVEE